MKIKNIFLVALASTAMSCTDNYKEWNTNQHEATDEMLSYDNLRIGGFVPQMQIDLIPTSDDLANEFQRAQNLAGDIYAGYMAGINTWNGGINGTTYSFAEKWQNEAFDVAFRKVMPAWKMIANGSKEENPQTYAFAQIMKVTAMHRITDMYGPIPYSQFGHGGITTPYDSQEEVYNLFFKELNEAIAILSDFVAKNPTARPLKKFDMIYGGDYSKWVKFANSLKLRLAIRISYVQPDLAKQYAEEAVAAGVLESNTDNANLATYNGITVFNPLYKCWQDYNDTRMGANMESFLKGYNDARIGKYFQSSTFDNVEFRGIRNGVRINSYVRNNYIKFSAPNIQPNTPVQIMCAAEVSFLKAEGALRGWNMGGSAQSFYEDGVRKSFAQWGADLGGYLNNNTATPAPYTDPVSSVNNIDASDARLSNITIAWNDNDGFERKLERIITQKWIAIYPDGQEAWSEFRRTNYPKVFPVVINASVGKVSTETQIRRLEFPTTEYDNNEEEVLKAVQLIGGQDTGGTKLWWDKK